MPKCIVCDDERHRDLYLTRDRHYGIPGEYRLIKCTTCSLVSLDPMLSDAELSKLYPNDYYAYQTRFEPNRLTQTLKRLLGVNNRTKDPNFSSPGTMLDVGCGSGWFLSRMRDQGWTVHGVEMSTAAAQLGREVRGLNIFAGPLEKAGFPTESFDYVRLNHSFEHMSQPGKVLGEIFRILKSAGKLFIGVPNIESANARLFGKYWWYLGPPVHTYNYSVRTLSSLLMKHGFKVERVVYNSDYSGVLGSAQIWWNRHNGRKSDDGFLYRNVVFKVLAQRVAKTFDLFKLGDAIEITASRNS